VTRHRPADPAREVGDAVAATLPRDQRLQFVADHQRGLFDMRALCACYGVSRKTGYKWLARYAAEEPRGLHDRSHVPHTCPHRIDGAVAALLLAARRRHPIWGPAKLVQYLAPRHVAIDAWPRSAPSLIS
jgi:putative transposase